MTPPPDDQIALRPYGPHDRDWVTTANVAFYRAQHGFDEGFARAVADALDSLEAGSADAPSRYLVAEDGYRRVGCIFLGPDAPGAGRIRLFYLDAALRGRGLGRHLLNEVMGTGAFAVVKVSTFDIHPEACRLYERAGFDLIGAAPVRAFGREMEQRDYEWRRDGSAGRARRPGKGTPPG